MDNLEAFKNRIHDLKEEAYERNILLPFYNLENQLIISRSFKHNDYVRPYFYGGYKDSEYKRVIFSINEVDNEDFQIAMLKIKPFLKTDILNHRMILGSILGLGLKREIVGDIIYTNDAYYAFVCLNMANFIKENLVKIGKVNVECKIVEEEINYEVSYLEETVFIASLRLDNLVAASYNLGRAKAQSLISDGYVKINHDIVLKDSKLVKEQDLLSIKGKGRVIVSEICGKTKSGNLIVKIKKPK